MNLGDMAELVCSKVGRTDSDSLTLCKTFLKRRYQLVYNQHMWKDSLDIAEIQSRLTEFGPTNMPIMPRWMELVVAVRVGDSTTLSVEDQSLFFKRDPALFNRSGSSPDSFHQIRPYFFPFYLPSDGDIYIKSLNGGDDGKKVHLADTDSGIVRSVTLTSTYVSSISLEDIIEPKVTKDITNGPVSFGDTSEAEDFVIPGYETDVRFERIRLLQDPGETVTLLVLAKRRITSLSADSDSPIIQGIDDALIAHAQADMLENSRQYAKSESKRSEAVAQVKVAIDMEKNQSASVSRITPADYADIKNGDDI